MKHLKKLSLTLVALLALSTGAWAQKRGGTNADASVAKARIMAKTPRRALAIPENATILYQQNFDGTNDINQLGWTFVDNDGNGRNWTMSINGKYDDGEFSPSETSTSVPNSLYSQSYTDDGYSAINADNWAITPAIEIYESTILSFQLAYGNPEYPDKFGVYVGETANVNEMTEVLPLTIFSRTAKRQFNEERVDLSAFAGKTCYIAFRHKDNDKYVVLIDDVVVYKRDPRFYLFKMPANDVTATYTIKRDMSVDMAVTVKDANDNSRFRVQKQGNSYEPFGQTKADMQALFKVHDDIENKYLTVATDYTIQIFAADENDNATGDAMTFATFTYAPGKYVAKAVAADGSNYNGTSLKSNVFTLYEGYDVTVPAGEYVTFYKDEALTLNEGTTDAELYTITAVNGDKATATELTVAAANTPILVKNNSVATKTIVLIPTTTDTPDNVTAYSGFTGTLEAASIPASTTTQNNYAFNGKEFVWVKTAIPVAANKAWLEVPVTASAAPQIRLIFSSTTGIESVDREQSTVDGWYDLNGRRLPGKPTKKGVYIVNGKKMVVK